jgi:hypothetical protein
VSVGHVARLLEEAGIATVIVASEAFRLRLESMAVPRLLVTPHPMGRPLGPPGDQARHREVIRAALRLLERGEKVGTMVG